jgi:hypothetical protein
MIVLRLSLLTARRHHLARQRRHGQLITITIPLPITDKARIKDGNRAVVRKVRGCRAFE